MGNIINFDIPDGVRLANNCKDYILNNPRVQPVIERPEWVYDKIEYNVFTFPHSSLTELYHHIRNNFWSKAEESGVNAIMPHYIQGWVNVFHKGEKIGWHAHVPENYPNMYHGVFYVSSPKDSYTLYAEPRSEYDSEPKILEKIKSIQGDCHIINDMTTPHTSTENTSDEPRITIAFDIVGFDYYENLWPRPSVMHYIPFV